MKKESAALISGIDGLEMNHVEATYLAWIDTRKIQIKNPAAFFEKAGVGLSSEIYFGAEGFLRLNFGCPASQLKKALDRIKAAFRVQ